FPGPKAKIAKYPTKKAVASSYCPNKAQLCTEKATSMVTNKGIVAKRVNKPRINKIEQKNSANMAKLSETVQPSPNRSINPSFRSLNSTSLVYPWYGIISAPNPIRKIKAARLEDSVPLGTFRKNLVI